MSGKEIVEAIAQLKEGHQTKIIDLGCGSFLGVRREPAGFYFAVADPQYFAKTERTRVDHEARLNVGALREAVAWPMTAYDSNRLYVFVTDKAIPTLRALVCGLQRNAKHTERE